MTEPGKDRKIAVIGVHGVGDQVAGETAAKVVRLLEAQHGKKYRAFASESLKIPVDAKGLDKTPADAAGLKIKSAAKTAKWDVGFHSVFHKNQPDVHADLMGIDFTASLLRGDPNSTTFYETSFWRRKDRPTKKGPEVDIYEMFWSDLSHGSSSGSFAVLGQFIQLLVHLASLGRTTAATALPEISDPDRRRTWNRFYCLNACSYWLLSMPILIGNLWLILMGGLFIAVIAGADKRATILAPSSLLLGFEIAVIATYSAYRWLPSHPLGPWLPIRGIAAPVIGCLAGVLWYFICRPNAFISPLSLPSLLVLSGGGYFLVAQYEQMRPGASRLYLMIGAAVAIIMTAFLIVRYGLNFSKSPGFAGLEFIADCAWYTSEWLFVGLLICGGLFLIVNFALLGFGVYLAFSTKNGAEHKSIATCMATTLLPGPFFGGLMLWFWTMVSDLFAGLPGGDQITSWNWLCTRVASFLNLLMPITAVTKTPHWLQLLSAMIDGSARLSFLYYDVALALALILMTAAFAPSVLAELLPLNMQTSSLEQCSSFKLGLWLDSGFVFLGILALIAVLASVGVFLLNAWLVYDATSQGALPDWATEISIVSISAATGTVALGYLAATKALSGNISETFGRLRVLVDTILDVDNWLRERPQGDTMRLQVFARFNSLLRYLKSEGYTEIVIVAHSQGTVITADLLRYLQHLHSSGVSGGSADEKSWSEQKLQLLTMGCPLRQLYSWRVPFLYGWAGKSGANFTAGPDLKELGLARWYNAYGSGDYIGRNLWPSTKPFDPGPVNPVNLIKNCRDICVGPLAHTRYLDESNKMIAALIDGLIS